MDAPSPSVFWECAFQHRLLLAPLCWSDILVGLTLRPVRWDYSLPYGIFSRTATRDVAAAFLDFIHKTYNLTPASRAICQATQSSGVSK